MLTTINYFNMGKFNNIKKSILSLTCIYLTKSPKSHWKAGLLWKVMQLHSVSIAQGLGLGQILLNCRDTLLYFTAVKKSPFLITAFDLS